MLRLIINVLAHLAVMCLMVAIVAATIFVGPRGCDVSYLASYSESTCEVPANHGSDCQSCERLRSEWDSIEVEARAIQDSLEQK